MPDPRRGYVPPSETDATAREFLDAQEPKPPATTAELRDATRHAFDSAIRTLGNTASLEEWVAATNDLEDAFFDSNDGALAEQVRLALGKDALDATEWAACEELVRQTADVAARIYPIVHRLQSLGFAATREEVVRKLEVGDLSATTKVHGVSIVPRRRTLIGLLRDIDAKLGANVWSLEFPPELPAKVVVSDPFDVADEETARLWRHRKVAKNAIAPTVDHSVLAMSGDVTMTVAYELGTVAERTDDPRLKEAATTVVAWFERKSIYYQDPDARDFALYHLGMEQPQDLMKIFRSLDAIKHADPELFLELMGINPDGGGKSPYFGSFLHKALYNTQRAVDHADKLGEMAIRTMLRQLLTLDATVSTYSGVVSQEALKAIGAQIKERVESEPSSADKARTLMMLAVPFSQLAIDAEVRRQLDELREANLENVKAEFRRHLDDLDHPLKFVDYLQSMPRAAFDDEVCHEIRKAFKLEDAFAPSPDSIQAYVREHYDKGRYFIAAQLYQRIPLLDESRADLGFGHRMVVAIRDIDAIERLFSRSIATSPKDAYEVALDGLKLFVGEDALSHAFTKENVDALSSQLSFVQRRFLNYALEEISHERFGENRKTLARLANSVDVPSIDPFVFGQLLVEDAIRNLGRNAELILDTIPNPDLVLLSVLAHPMGAEVAFKHFDKFCGRIPSYRLAEILEDRFGSRNHPAIASLRKIFYERKPEPHTSAYVQHLRDNVWGHKAEGLEIVGHEMKIQWYLNLNRVLVEKRTPWTVKSFHGGGDEQKNTFDLWQTIVDSQGKELVAAGLHYLPVPNADQIEWGEREQKFIESQMRDNGRWRATITNSDELGIVLAMHDMNLFEADQTNTIVLSLKSRPA